MPLQPGTNMTKQGVDILMGVADIQEPYSKINIYTKVTLKFECNRKL